MDTTPADQTPAGALISIVGTVVRRRKFVTRFVLLVTVGTTIIALLMPKWYKSAASIFPAERADLFGGLEGVSSLVKNFTSPGKALSSLGGPSEADRYLAILKSGTVMSAVIQKFDLVHVYNITSYPIENTVKELLGNVEFSVEPEGNLTITVYDKNPQRAADMVNYFVEMLNKTNTELQVQSARGNRQFIGDRYEKNLVDLRAAEDSLKAFQQRHGIIALPEQTEASIKAAAEITGKLASMEVHAAILRRTLAPDNPSVAAAQIEIEELHRKLTDMNLGRGLGKDDMKVFVPFKEVPELGAEYLRRYREVEIQYKILQFILPMYEQAKVEERRETPSVVVLDRGGPAERKSRPKVTLYALIALVGSLLVSFIVILLMELHERVKAGYSDQYDAVVSALRHDWFGLKLFRWRR